MSGDSFGGPLVDMSSSINEGYFWHKEVYDADVVDINSPVVSRVTSIPELISSHPSIADGNSFSVKSDKRIEDGEIVVEVKCEPTVDDFDTVVAIGTLSTLILSRATIVGSPMASLSVAVADDFTLDGSLFDDLGLSYDVDDEEDEAGKLGEIEG